MGSPERKKKRNFPIKALRCSLACSQNKGVCEYQRRASWLCTGLSQRQRGRCATARARRQGVISVPETGILHQTMSRLPVTNYVFLGSWTVDISQEGCSLRSAPQRRHTGHLIGCSHGIPGNQAAGTAEVIKMHSPPGKCTCQVPGHLSCSDLGRA